MSGLDVAVKVEPKMDRTVRFEFTGLPVDGVWTLRRSTDETLWRDLPGAVARPDTVTAYVDQAPPLDTALRYRLTVQAGGERFLWESPYVRLATTPPPVNRGPVELPPWRAYYTVGQTYHVELSDCCITGEFTSVLVSETEDDGLVFANGVRLSNGGRLTAVEPGEVAP